MKKLMTGLCIALGLTMASQANAETTECTEITTIPTVITVQGVYCLKGNLATAMTSGNAIEIQTNNVTIDFNGWKLGGLAGGPATTAYGIYAKDRRNIVLRNGSIRGFLYGISLDGNTTNSSGHLIEDMILDGNKFVGILAEGTGMVIRNNRIVNTGVGVSVNAFGIYVGVSSNSFIAGNLVSKTSEEGNTFGVYVYASSLIEVLDNTVLETAGGFENYGITVSKVTDATIQNNRIKNATGTGLAGIYDEINSTGIDCIGNVIRGFTGPLLGCDYISGNHTP